MGSAKRIKLDALTSKYNDLSAKADRLQADLGATKTRERGLSERLRKFEDARAVLKDEMDRSQCTANGGSLAIADALSAMPPEGA